MKFNHRNSTRGKVLKYLIWCVHRSKCKLNIHLHVHINCILGVISVIGLLSDLTFITSWFKHVLIWLWGSMQSENVTQNWSDRITWGGCSSRGRARVLLLEGCWLDSPGLHVQMLVSTLHGSHCHQCLNVCMNYCKSLWAKVSAKRPKCTYQHHGVKCTTYASET